LSSSSISTHRRNPSPPSSQTTTSISHHAPHHCLLHCWSIFQVSTPATPNHHGLN
jgi:hypothetical protein